MTETQFTKNSHIPASLIEAVIEQIGGWEEFEAHAEDVCNHGADAGFSGFTYYAETVEFSEKNRANIMQIAADMASDLGADGKYSLIAGFRCLDDMTADSVADAIHDKNHEDYTQVMNSLAWFALEEVSRSYADQN